MANLPIPKPEASQPAIDLGHETDLAELAALFATHSGDLVPSRVSTDLALEIVLNEIVEQACLATGATGATVILRHDGEMICRASNGPTAPELGMHFSTESGITAECIRTREVQRCNDTQSDSRVDVEACLTLGVRSVMAVPLLRDDRLEGVLEVFSARPSAFGNRDENTLNALAQRILKNLADSEELSTRAAAPRLQIVESAPSKNEIELAEPLIQPEISPAPAALAPPVELPLEPWPIPAPQASSAAPPTFDEIKHEVKKDESPVEAPVAARDELPIETEEVIANSASTNRGINIVTASLAAAVVCCAVLLVVLVGVRLSSRRGASIRQSAASTAPTPETNAIAVTASNSTTPLPTHAASASPTDGLTITTVAPARRSAASSGETVVPAGGLVVYEGAKEVFRMNPDGSGTSHPNDSTQNASARNGPVQNAALTENSPQAVILHREEPDYPEQARAQGIQGPVVVDVKIGKDGHVQDASAISGEQILSQAAVAAVKRWQFKPRMIGGHPVEMETQLTLNFRLSQ